MAIPTYNTKQTDTAYNPAAYNAFPSYKPWNPFANQNKQQQPVQQRYPAYWQNSPAAAMPVHRSASPFAEQTRRVGNAALPLPLPMVRREMIAQRQPLQPIRPTALQSQQAQRAAAQMQVDIRQRNFLNDLRAGKYASIYDEWQASGGVNRQLTDWFDPYDPAGSPYMTSQYVPQTNYDGYGGYGGYGGGWGGYGGGGYEHQDTASFYQGNYTQRRNRWNETLLTWGLRQQ